MGVFVTIFSFFCSFCFVSLIIVRIIFVHPGLSCLPNCLMYVFMGSVSLWPLTEHLVIQETKTTLIINIYKIYIYIYKTNLEDSYFSTSHIFPLSTHLGNFQGNIEIKFLDFRLLMEPCFSLTHNVTHKMIAMVLTLEPKPHFQYSGCLGLGS